MSRGFKSSTNARPLNQGDLAQLAARLTPDQKVGSSILSVLTFFVEQLFSQINRND